MQINVIIIIVTFVHFLTHSTNILQYTNWLWKLIILTAATQNTVDITMGYIYLRRRLFKIYPVDFTVQLKRQIDIYLLMFAIPSALLTIDA